MIDNKPHITMNPLPNITSYHIGMEDASGNGGKLGVW